MEIGKVLWEDLSELYQHLHKKCLCFANCSENYRETLDEIFLYPISRNILRNDETQKLLLLSSAVTQLCAKSCLRSSGSDLCEKIATLAKHVTGDPFLDAQVNYLVSDGNKFVHRAVLRSLTHLLYMLDEDRFMDRVRTLLDLLESTTSVKSIVNLLNLFELVMDYSLKSVHVLEHYSGVQPSAGKLACRKQVQLCCSSLDDLKFKCCTLLCHNWTHLVQKFFNQRSDVDHSEVFTAFLCLWRSSLRAIEEDRKVLQTLCSNEQLISLFVSLTPTDPISLKMFLEILVLTFSLEDTFLPCDDRKNECQEGELLINAINSGLLENLPIQDQKCGFGGGSDNKKTKTTKQPLLESYSGNTTCCDEIAVKKIVFVVLTILSASKISARLLTAFGNTEAFVKGKMHLTNDVPAHLWILDLFFDQDDLLIAALLSSLHLYTNLGIAAKTCDVPRDDIIKLRSSLNPHKAFIVFVQRLGGDHHVILDFLLSNETCILHYLMQLLKTILAERELFSFAHNELKDCRRHLRHGVMNLGTSEATMHEDKTIDSIVKEGSNLSSTVSFTTLISQQPRLVSYSSTSSSCSDFELSPLAAARCPQDLDECKERFTVEGTVSVLSELRQALEKHVGYQAFPYTVDPLIKMLRKCECMDIT